MTTPSRFSNQYPRQSTERLRQASRELSRIWPVLSSFSLSLSDDKNNDDNGKKKERRILLQRAAVTAVSCVTTWSLVHLLGGKGMSTVRACGLHAMAASVLFRSPVYATASLTGSFAGMTGLVAMSSIGTTAAASTTAMAILRNAILPVAWLGFWTGASLYWWEKGGKIFPGMGGRLGTIAVVGHVAFLAICNRPVLRSLVCGDAMQAFWQAPYTALGLLVATGVLHWSRQEPEPLGTTVTPTIIPPSKTTAIDTTTDPSNNPSIKLTSSAKEARQALEKAEAENLPVQNEQGVDQEAVLRLRNVAKLASKSAILCFLVSLIQFPLQPSLAQKYLQSILATFVGSFLVWRTNHAPVFSVGFTCWAASCLFPAAAAASMNANSATTLMMCMAMGSYAGLTRLGERYNTNFQLLQTAIVATLLFQMDLLPKIGGRLGLFAFLGVGFGL
ncbi:hypothetical protein ACA910_022149 [Epithemia clementina (nom. ined.)]